MVVRPLQGLRLLGVWVALCRRTRQVVFWFAGDRSADSCRQLWAGIPDAYRAAHTYSDFWQAYQGVFGENHQSVGKETGQTAHIERWNNTLRQRCAGSQAPASCPVSQSQSFAYWVPKLELGNERKLNCGKASMR
jgi:IS1 family transposase